MLPPPAAGSDGLVVEIVDVGSNGSNNNGHRYIDTALENVGKDESFLRMPDSSISFSKLKDGRYIFCCQGVYMALTAQQRNDMEKAFAYLRYKENENVEQRG